MVKVDYAAKCETLAKELLRVANTIDCIGDHGDELAIVLKAAAALSRVPKLVAALRTLHDGTRDYAARGMGESLPVEFEMPPSTAKRVRALICEALEGVDDER